MAGVNKSSIYKCEKNFWKRLNKQKSGYLFILPQMIVFAALMIYPMFETLRLSFYDFSITQYKLVGFGNYLKLINDPFFQKAIINTLWFVIAIVPTSLAFSLFVAVLSINKSEAFRSFVRGAFYLPVVVSFVSLSMVWAWIYNPANGLLRYIFLELGLKPINFLGDTRYSLASLILIIFTTSLGQPIIIYIAALGGIPKTYFEAASIDGANAIQNFFNITLPLLKPSTLYLVLITTINTFQVFVVVQLLTGGGPNYATTTILFEIYTAAFKFNNFGLASTMGMILFVIVLILTYIQFRYLSTEVEY